RLLKVGGSSPILSKWGARLRQRGSGRANRRCGREAPIHIIADRYFAARGSAGEVTTLAVFRRTRFRGRAPPFPRSVRPGLGAGAPSAFVPCRSNRWPKSQRDILYVSTIIFIIPMKKKVIWMDTIQITRRL